MKTKLTIKWQLCQLIAHLSEKEQAIVLFLSANYLKEKVKLPPHLTRGNYSQLAAKVGKLRKAQVNFHNSEVPLFDSISYKRGTIAFKFSEPIEQLLTKTGDYLSFNFKMYCGLSGKYAKNTYLQSCRFRLLHHEGKCHIDRALHLYADSIGATAPSYRNLSSLRRLLDNAFERVAAQKCAKFTLTDSGKVFYFIEKRWCFSEHRIQVDFELTDGVTDRKRILAMKKGKPLYLRLRDHYGVNSHYASLAALNIEGEHLQALINHANGLPTREEKAKYLVACIRNAISQKNLPRAKNTKKKEGKDKNAYKRTRRSRSFFAKTWQIDPNRANQYGYTPTKSRPFLRSNKREGPVNLRKMLSTLFCQS